MGYLLSELSSLEDRSGYDLTHDWSRNKNVHIFLKCIRKKVNVIARLEFELAYYDVAVLYVSHYARKLFSIENRRTLFEMLKACIKLTSFVSESGVLSEPNQYLHACSVQKRKRLYHQKIPKLFFLWQKKNWDKRVYMMFTLLDINKLISDKMQNIFL